MYILKYSVHQCSLSIHRILFLLTLQDNINLQSILSENELENFNEYYMYM